MFAIAALSVITPTILAAGTGDGSSSANACPGSCTGTGVNRTCTFTATLDVYASRTGYYKFAECGDTVQPVLEMERNVEYTFLQNDATMWLHPLGFAYFPDGAHEGVDELEPGISYGTSGCETDNTCQAPMYYLDTYFYGNEDPETGAAETTVYPAADNGGNFGLDSYEPAFQQSRGDWIGLNTGIGFNVKLTITDDSFDGDFFYFCHIHNKMSGRIKIVDSTGVQVHVADTPELYSFDVPTNFDNGCGTSGLGQYVNNDVCPPLASNKFICSDPSSPQATLNFDECLSIMDCAMHEEMRVTADENPIVTFMLQMIPHHDNAVNMAKALLKTGDITPANDPEGELTDLMWTIINEQNMQITAMQGYLASESKPTPEEAAANCSLVEDTSATGMGMGSGAGVAGSAGIITVDDDCDDERRGYAIWAAITTALLVMTWGFIIYSVLNKSEQAPVKGPTTI